MLSSQVLRLLLVVTLELFLSGIETYLNLSEIYVAGVVTAPQKLSISYQPIVVTSVQNADVDAVANPRIIPVQPLTQSMSDPDLFDSVLKLNPDVFLVVGWYHMILNMQREPAPAYRLHAYLLPDYSGGVFLFWAMINEEL